MEKKAKVLLVKDEEDIRELIYFHLFRSGYEVYGSSIGEKALKIANKSRPDLVLLDRMIPKLDGLSLCKTLKTSADTKHIKIIFLSARGSENASLKGLKWIR